MKLPQLSLRELFLLVVVAAMGCGWWVDHRRLTRNERLRQLGLQVRNYHGDSYVGNSMRKP
jgi:hypothetical protein